MSILEADLHFLDSVDKVADFLTWLHSDHAMLAVDTETNAKHWARGGKVRLFQIADHKQGWAIPFDGHRALCKHALDWWTGPFIFHNAKFDVIFLMHELGWKPQWANIHDSFLASKVINEFGHHGLKPLGTWKVHPAAAAGQGALEAAFDKYGWDWATVPLDLPAYSIYGAFDTVLTVYLFEELMKQLNADEGFMRAYLIEQGSIESVCKVEMHGITVDPDYIAAKTGDLRVEADEIAKQVREQYGDEWSISSNNSMSALLVREGVPLYERTPTDKFKMNKDVVAEFENFHPLVGMMSTFRKNNKIISTYYDALMELRNADNQVFAEFRQCEADTLRMSVANPPFQQIPSRSEKGKMVRRSIVAPPGQKLIAVDLAQIEFRIFAHLANDPGLIQTIRDGLDIHSFVAAKAFRTEAPTSKQRAEAKSVVFGSLYGAGARKIAHTLGYTEEDGQVVYDSVHNAFPTMKRFSKGVEQEAKRHKRNGLVSAISMYGNRLTIGEDDAYKLTNYMIQSPAALLFKECLLRASACGLSDFFTNFVHDELVVSVPDDHETIREVSAILHDCFSDSELMRVPVTCEVSAPSDDWSQCK
jgi:DNA polymerase-1